MMTNGNRFMSDINVTPFVDVMLVLLIIFMVTAPMMMQGVNLSLPETTSEPLNSESEHITVTINNRNQIHINDYEVSINVLQKELLKIIKGDTSREVYLRADKNIPYGIVIKVMSEIKMAGIEKLGIVTTPVKDEKENSDE